MQQTVDVVGAGLAGSECALQLADRGVNVRLHEERPVRMSPAHHTDRFAELVCSNSLKSTKPETAAGVLKWELDAMGCRLLAIARACSVPAGGALAVDRERFSDAVTEAVSSHPLIEVVREEVTELPCGPAVIAAGPLLGYLAGGGEGVDVLLRRRRADRLGREHRSLNRLLPISLRGERFG